MARDFWIGLVALGFAGLYWHEAGKIRISPLDGPVGASGLPKTLAIALAVLAAAMILRSLVERLVAARARSEAAPVLPLVARLRPHLRAIGMLALGVGYLLIIPYTGYLIGIMALILAVALYVGALSDLRTIAIAVLGGVLFHLLFVEFLGIPLPTGVLVETVLKAGA